MRAVLFTVLMLAACGSPDIQDDVGGAPRPSRGSKSEDPPVTCSGGSDEGAGGLHVSACQSSGPLEPATPSGSDPSGSNPSGSGNEPATNPSGSAPPDYLSCAKLPSAGKRGYGTCAAGEVVVIVNDGEAQEMTCCPVGANVLSANPAEQNVVRTGLCGPDEVATGMKDPTAPSVYCTKINTTYLRLSAPTTATYVRGTVPGVLGEIARSYNISDTCICNEGYVVAGGHVGQDNQCADQCVRIEKK